MARDLSTDSNPGYDAFISYSQRGDKAIARALRSVIQTIGKPWWQVRSLNIFLDATSLSASPGLWQGIEEKLDRSRYLVLLASPEAAASKWVDREVGHFVETHGIDRLLIALTDGALQWDETTGGFPNDDILPLPPCLRDRFAEEPLWVDLRAFRANPVTATKNNQAFLRAALDLAATIRGVEKADLYSEEVRRQRRSIRLAYGVATIVAGLGIGAGLAAWIAVENERRATAEAERAIANFDIAKSTVDRVIFDIAQGLQDVEGMRLETLRTILTRVEAAMTRLTRAAPDDLSVQRSRGAMLIEFGDTYLDAGDRPSALAAYNEALTIRRRLAETDSRNAESQREISVSLIRIGDAKAQAGDIEGALTAYGDGMAIHRDLVETDPGNTMWQRDLSASLDRVGNIWLRYGDEDRALTAYDESIAIRRRLAETDPDNGEWQRGLSVSLNKIADIKLHAGDADGALAHFDEGVIIRRRLAETDPDNTKWQRDLSVSLDKIADIRLRAGDPKGALSAYEESLAVVRRLVKTDPGNILWQRDLSIVLMDIGDVRLSAGDTAGALAAYDEGLAIRRRVAGTDSDNALWQAELAHSLWRARSAIENAGQQRTLLAEALAILTALDSKEVLDVESIALKAMVEMALDDLEPTPVVEADHGVAAVK